MTENTTETTNPETNEPDTIQELKDALEAYMAGKENLLKVWQDWLTDIEKDLKAVE